MLKSYWYYTHWLYWHCRYIVNKTASYWCQSLSSNLSLILTSNPPPVTVESPPGLEHALTSLDVDLAPSLSQVTGHVRHGVVVANTPPPVVPTTRPRLTKPSAYNPSLSPLPSPLRPHCLAKDRLRLWKPSLDVLSHHSSVPEDDLSHVFEVMLNAWADSTRETYSAGILVYHVYCNVRGLPEDQRAPASQHVITSFVASLAGSYSGSTINNYIHGIRAWHVDEQRSALCT